MKYSLRRPGRASGGFSLLELMIVMAIAAALIGTGAGVYIKMGRRSAAQQALHSISQLVMRAKAASNRYPATLVADPANGLLHAYADQRLQELHFEARPTESGPGEAPLGIDGRSCELVGGRVAPDIGRVGGGCELIGGSIDCGNYAAYDLRDGVNAEIWVRPNEPSRIDLLKKGRSYAAALEMAGGRPRVTFEIQVQDPAGAQEKVQRIVNVPSLRLGEWVGVRISYDRSEMVIATSDGFGFVERDRWPETRALALDTEQKLLIASGLRGYVDDVRVGGIRSADPLQLPYGVAFAGKNPPIRFAGGRLDPARHTTPASISIQFEGKVSTFEIGSNGQILALRESDTPPPEKPAEARPVPVEKE